VDFVLLYRGPLASSGSTKEKHQIRSAIHPQLKTLCSQEPEFEKAQSDELPEGLLKGRKVEVPRPLEALFFVVQLGGFRFVPLINRPHQLACSIDVIFLRREKPGAIVQGGDLDNRLKTLFDALRMPHDESELSGVAPGSTNERIYCLLEDDSLITRVSVSTHQLLEPLFPDGTQTDVELLMHVVVQSTYPMWGNVGF
jgi:hypothetical protein